jgi:hypothetical protein
MGGCDGSPKEAVDREKTLGVTKYYWLMLVDIYLCYILIAKKGGTNG